MESKPVNELYMSSTLNRYPMFAIRQCKSDMQGTAMVDGYSILIAACIRMHVDAAGFRGFRFYRGGGPGSRKRGRSRRRRREGLYELLLRRLQR